MRRILLWTMFSYPFLNSASGQEIPLPEKNAADTSTGTDYSGGKAGNMEAD
mgnify:CR=1 FL=1